LWGEFESADAKMKTPTFAKARHSGMRAQAQN
jgi:hypothetical protein